MVKNFDVLPKTDNPELSSLAWPGQATQQVMLSADDEHVIAARDEFPDHRGSR